MIYNDEDPVVLWHEHDTKAPTPRFFNKVQEYIDKSDVVVAHHMKHDMNVLRYYGVNFNGVELHCTMLTEYLLSGQDPQDHNFDLSSVAESYGMDSKLDAVKNLWDIGIHTREIDPELLEEYVIDDTQKVKEIYACQIPRVNEDNMEALVALQNEYIFSLSDIEINGILWDAPRALEITKEYTKIVSDIEDQILEIIGDKRLNVGSSQHLSAILFGGTVKVTRKEWTIRELKVRPESYYYEREIVEECTIEGLGFEPDPRSETKTPGIYATDKDTVSYLKAKTKEQKAVKKLLLDRSGAAKVLSSIAGKKGDAGLSKRVMPDGLLHPQFNQCIARTGRLTSSDPNGQNLPRGSTSPIKECITSRLDGIFQWDLSQIEWRVAGVLSYDEMMLHEINNLIDQHIAAVKEIMELPFRGKDDPESKDNRTNAKVLNFRMIYGGSFWGFFLDPKMPNFTKKKWQKICQKFYEKYWGLEQWQNGNIKTVLNNGGWLRVPTGRKFKFHKYPDKQGVLVYNERQIKNYPVQGVAGGDILPLFIVILRRALLKYGFRSRMVLTVHDSIVFDYVKEELEALTKLCIKITQQLPQTIERYFGMEWPCRLDGEAEIGPNYGTLKGYADSVKGVY